MEKSYKFGLLGFPVSQSRSPVIHNTLGELKNIDLTYELMSTEPEILADRISNLYESGYDGFNVTVPHKCNVIPSLVGISTEAKCVGAVNTCVRTEGGYFGYNTDIYGITKSIEEAGADITNRICVVYGAGGAARAVIYSLISMGAGMVYVIDRTVEKAKKLADDINCVLSTDKVGIITEEAAVIELTDIFLFQCTSVGMKAGECIVKDMRIFEHSLLAFDIIAMDTEFVRIAGSRGIPSQNGTRMLLYQGIKAFELWTGLSVTEDEISKMKEATGL